MSNANLFSHFKRQIDDLPDKELLCTGDNQSRSYRDVDRGSAKIAQLLTDAGMKPRDRVSVQVEKSTTALELYLACLRAGFVFHPLNTGYQSSELEFFIGDAEPTVVICDPEKEAFFNSLAGSTTVQSVYTLSSMETGSLPDACGDFDGDFDVADSAADDLAALLYSSGTTGVPKGIMLTHGNLVRNTESLVDAWEFTDTDRLLHALPIFHVHGLFVAIGCVMMSGANMRWLTSYDAKEALRYLPECSVMMGVPTYYTRLLGDSRLNKETCENVRVFISGSAPLLPETFEEFESRTGHRILERYGMTETNMNTSNPLHGLRKPGTVGPPLPGVSVRIKDNDGIELPVGEIGNLQVRGENVFAGYWKLPEKTAEDIDEQGWFNTGDKGVIDEDGYVSIVGRAKDMIISGGLNVYPKEVELFIDDLQGVKESAVIGVPHADFGEAVVAIVVKDTDASVEETAIIDAAKESMANFKVPKAVVFVENLPRNTMSKVQKNALRDQYRNIFSG
jgi:malonyl-CoA/methylmalonyl-CoA synthetase